MTRRQRLGTATVEVLQAIASGHRYGFEIMSVTRLAAGTVYPALATLERDGFTRSGWEDPRHAQREKRPARRNYVVTAKGKEALGQHIERVLKMSETQRSAARTPDLGDRLVREGEGDA